jgi:hypothetical protein
MVPIFMFVVLVPPNPLMTLLLSCVAGLQSLQFDAICISVHRLSILIVDESVSNEVWLSFRPPVPCIATAAKARKESF